MCGKIYIERKYDLLHQHSASCGGQNASMHSGPYEIYIGSAGIHQIDTEFKPLEIGSPGIL